MQKLHKKSWQHILGLVLAQTVFSWSSISLGQDIDIGSDWPQGHRAQYVQQSDEATGPTFQSAKEPDSEKNKSSQSRWKKRAYHFGVGIAKPNSFGNEYNHYEKLFGKPRIHPQVWGEYYFFNLGVDIGFRSSIAYYTARGNVAKNLDPNSFPLEQDLTDDQIDHSQVSRLTLIPVQAAAVISYSPLPSRWLILQGWYGRQWVYVQNTMAPKDSEQEAGTTFLNNGWNEEQVYGAAISLDLSWIDHRSTYSMKVFGISGIYLTPFFEVHKAVKSRFGAYDRSNYGLMFTFESIR